jgi:hypothetical protein
MRPPRTFLLRLSLGVLVASGGVIPSALHAVYAQQAADPDDGIGRARFVVDQSVTNFSATALTIPYWRSQFTDPSNGVTYPFTMVGSDPSLEASTTVPTVIVPLKFTFVASVDSVHVLDGTDTVTDTLASPVFQTADIGNAANTTASAPPFGARTVAEPSDVTQVGDAIVRAQWAKSGTGYHVLLGQPDVIPTVSFTVPQNLGFIAVGRRTGAHIGLMDIQWFANRLNETMRNLHIPPTTLPIFLVNNTFLYIGNSANCCVLGFHGATSSLNGAGRQLVNTYMFASYSTPGIFGANPGDSQSYIADIHGLSHEVQEWLDDPFVNNNVTPWLTPTAPQYGCTDLLETGDPVVGYGFEVTMANGTTYHPEDEVHFCWFARESPAQAAQGYFTYLNNFPDVAQGCN